MAKLNMVSINLSFNDGHKLIAVWKGKIWALKLLVKI